MFSGWTRVWLGDHEVAIEHVARAMRLSPHDPQFFNMQAATASAHFFAGRYAEASHWAETSLREQPNHLIAACIAAASSGLAGRPAEAQRAMTRLRQLDPTLRVSNIKDFFPFGRSEDLEKWVVGLAMAGLPE